MSSLNPIFALLISIFAILCVWATFRWTEGKPHAVRFGTIDGLRGYLAFFVFLHHASVWLSYSRTGIWTVPDSHLYTQLGQSSVSFFFMITSFLFYRKLLDSKHRQFDWGAFFAGRIFRLTPLYIAVMMVMFMIVAVISDGKLLDSPKYTLFCAARWLLFTIPGAPILNHVNAAPVTAGVTWSLPYEWCFYLLLPIISLATGQRPKLVPLLIAMAGVGLIWIREMQIQFGYIFIGGCIAAYVVSIARFRDFAATSVSSAIVVACLMVALLYPNAYETVPLIMLIIAFCFIAAGTDLFGLLLARTSRRLGELAYSIYLIHGILLFCLVNFVVGKESIAAMSGVSYWACIAGVTPCLLALCALTYRYVEQPGIAWGKRLTARRNGHRHAVTKAIVIPERAAD